MANDDLKMQAKRKMLKELKKLMMDQDFGDEGKSFKSNMKKVVVSSPTNEGVKKGLSLAEKMMAKKQEMDSEYVDPGYEHDADEDGEGKGEEPNQYMDAGEDDMPVGMKNSKKVDEEGGCPICGKEHGNREQDCKGWNSYKE